MNLFYAPAVNVVIFFYGEQDLVWKKKKTKNLCYALKKRVIKIFFPLFLLKFAITFIN